MYKGYFEVKQLKTGGIAVGFVPLLDDEDYPSGTTTLSFYRPQFHGLDLDNWELTSCGPTSPVPKIGFFGAPKGVAHPALVFGAQGIKARRKRATDSGYDKASFLVSNLLWHFGSKVPEPLQMKAGGLKVTVAPVDDYQEIADSIKAVRGIAPTADVLIETSDCPKRSLKDHADFMNRLVSVFRLVTGNRIDWLYGEAFDNVTGRAVERFHKDTVTGPFSKTIKFLPHMLDFEGLANAFFDDDRKTLKQDTLRKLIDYFVNCCDETSYLEARGLLASTLADLIVASYAETQKLQNFMKDDEFKTLVLPSLEEALERVKLPELSNEIRRRALQQLRGANRRSFDQRLDLLIDKFKLPLNSEDRRRVVNIRNKLVHEGKFPSKSSDDWYGDYSFILWVDFIALCRLAGYDGNLPLQAPYQR